MTAFGQIVYRSLYCSENQTYQALASLNVRRRVILTGTPIQVSHTSRKAIVYVPKLVYQNDLSEYYSLLNFCNPNFLGSKNDFRKNFENAIIRGRDADATDAVKAECEKKLKELGGIVSKFIIRRTNDLLSKYRPSSLALSHLTRLLRPFYSAGQVRASGLL